MRILSVIWGFPRLDQPFLSTRLLALAEQGHDVRVLCAPGDGQVPADVQARLAAGVETRRCLRETSPTVLRTASLLASAAARDPAFTRRAVGSLFDRHGGLGQMVDWPFRLSAVLPFAGERPDIVHFEFANWAMGFLDSLPVLPCPTVVTCHGSEVRLAPLYDQVLRRRLTHLFERIDRCVCVSNDLVEAVVNLGADRAKVAVIPMGVDTSFFSLTEPPATLPGGEVRLVSVGRLHWVKGYEYALEAVHLLRQRGRQVTYTIAGHDDGGGPAVRLARRDFGLDDVVRLAGPLSPAGVRNLLAASDIFVLPSLSEGLCVAALEAMSMGLPSVVTRVGGMPEAVADGRQGFLVPPRHPVALADAIERLSVDSDLRRRMGTAAASEVRSRFDAWNQTERVVALYEELLNRRSARPAHRAARPAT